MREKMRLKCFLVLISILLCLMVFLKTDNLLFSMLITVFFLILSNYMINFKKNALMVFYLISFGTFLLLTPIAVELLDFTNEYRVPLLIEEQNVTYICLILSLLTLAIGYSIKTKTNIKKVEEDSLGKKIQAYKFVSGIFTVLCLIPLIIESILHLRYVKITGYTASYLYNTNVNRGLIEPFKSLAMLAPIAYSFFLATKPSKKECFFLFAILLANGIIHLLSGDRFEIVSVIFFILIYQALRDNLENNNDNKWLDIKKVLILIICIPLIITLLQSTMYWREGNEVKIYSNIYTDFFYSVGGSSDLIGFAYRYKNELNNRPYSFGLVYSNLTDNIIGNMLGISKNYKNQTRQKALYGHSLSSTLTYNLYPQKYLEGYGMGDCYIADLFTDLSYLGVIIGNVFLGYIIKIITNIKKNKYSISVLSIFLIVFILRVPRDSFDYFISEFVGLKNWLFVLVFLLVSDMYYRKKVKK